MYDKRTHENSKEVSIMSSTEEEQIQFDISANLKRNLGYVGGNLKITNEKLYFKPHHFNIQKKELIIFIQEIKMIDTARILGVFPNGVVISLEDGTRYKFTIGLPGTNQKHEIIDYINGLIT